MSNPTEEEAEVTAQLFALTEAYIRDVLDLNGRIELFPDPQVRGLYLLLSASEATRLAALDQGILAIASLIDSITQRLFEELPEAEQAAAREMLYVGGGVSVPEMDAISDSLRRPVAPPRRRRKPLTYWLDRYEQAQETQPDLTLAAYARRRGLNYRSLVSLRAERSKAEKANG